MRLFVLVVLLGPLDWMTYSLRTIPGISSLLKPLEAVISSKFIPALTGRFVSNDERALLALPIRMGGLGIIDPQNVSDSEFAASEKVTFPLVGHILQQELSFGCHVVGAQRLAKSEVVASKHQAAGERAAFVCDSLPSDVKRMIFLLSEKGSSSWLSVLPVEEHGFALHKGAFRDALFLCYGWLPSGLPIHCVCGRGFSVDHALSCPTGGILPLGTMSYMILQLRSYRKFVLMFVLNLRCNCSRVRQ